MVAAMTTSDNQDTPYKDILQQQIIDFLDDYFDGSVFHEYTPLEKERYAQRILDLATPATPAGLETAARIDELRRLPTEDDAQEYEPEDLLKTFTLDIPMRIAELEGRTAPPLPPERTEGELALREKLAAIEHERWSDWQAWMHGVMWEHIPKKTMETHVWPILKRWDIQIGTPYDELSDDEKASDMEQVDRYWPLVETYTDSRIREVLLRLGTFVAGESGKSGRKEIEAAIDAELDKLNTRTRGDDGKANFEN